MRVWTDFENWQDEIYCGGRDDELNDVWWFRKKEVKV